tara:strand:+ start:3062 stop:3511 length:450 start_codon:yes stop_codon:yes gene_type:complete
MVFLDKIIPFFYVMESHELLKDYHLRITPIREKVLEVFFAYKGEAISKLTIENSLGSFDRVTLYRTIKHFKDKCVIHEVIDRNGHVRYALCQKSCKEIGTHSEHLHFYCSDCDRTECIEGEVNLDVDLPKGYKIDREGIVLNGQCSRCS